MRTAIIQLKSSFVDFLSRVNLVSEDLDISNICLYKVFLERE